MPQATNETSDNSSDNSDCQYHTEQDPERLSPQAAYPFLRLWRRNGIICHSGNYTVGGRRRGVVRSRRPANSGGLGKIGFFVAVALEWIEGFVCIIHRTCIELETLIIT